MHKKECSMILSFRDQQCLCTLVKIAFWDNENNILEADWNQVEQTANQQGVLWMLYLGAKACADHIPAEKLRAWRANMIGTVMRNTAINEVQNQVVSFLKERGIRAAVLKGLSCSMYYPLPETRALGDIDLLIDKENLPLVDEFLKKNGFRPEEKEHPFHVCYYGKGVAVEVHYEITQFPDSKGGKAVQEITKKFLDEVKTAHVNGMSFPVLSDSHQALMLLTHMERHLVIGGIGLRQLCDWAMFVNGSASKHWREKTLSMLSDCGLLTFAKVVTKTCVNFLGLSSEKAAWCMDVDDSLTELMIQDIFRSGSMGAAEEDNASSLFFDRTQLGKAGQNRLNGLLLRLNQLSYKHFPYTRKWKILLPIYWVYIPLRYLVRSMLGLRPKKSVARLLETSGRRQKLYKSLKLYQK